MANKTITDLTAGTAPDGTELVHVQQGSNSRKLTIDEVLALVRTSISTETGTSYTTVLADFAGGVVKLMSNASAITVTVGASVAGDEPCTFIQTGSGAVSFTPDAGVTINSLSGDLTIAGQNGSATLVRTATNVYYLIGALTT